MSLKFASLLFLAVSAHGSQSLLGLEYRSENSYRNQLVPTLGVVGTPFSNASLFGYTQFGLSAKDLESFRYGLTFSYRPISQTTFALNLTHRNLLPQSIGTTTARATARFQLSALGCTGFLGGGWYKTFTHLKDATVLPGFFGSDDTEHDFLIEIGGEIDLEPNTFRLFSANFDRFQTYRLNHPYFQAEMDIETEDWTLTPYFRYHFLLGFGRLDRIVAGAILVFKVKEPSS